MKNGKYTAGEFVEAWQTSNTYAEVVEKVGGSVTSVQVRASQYRRRGIPLKYFTGHHARLDVPAFKKLAKSLGDKAGK